MHGLMFSYPISHFKEASTAYDENQDGSTCNAMWEEKWGQFIFNEIITVINDEILVETPIKSCLDAMRGRKLMKRMLQSSIAMV